MRQFDVFANASSQSNGFAPFVVVLQSHYLELDSVVVAPLVRDKLPTSIDLAVEFQGETLVLALTELGAVRATSLRRSAGSLAEVEDDVRRALDRNFTGF